MADQYGVSYQSQPFFRSTPGGEIGKPKRRLIRTGDGGDLYGPESGNRMPPGDYDRESRFDLRRRQAEARASQERQRQERSRAGLVREGRAHESGMLGERMGHASEIQKRQMLQAHMAKMSERGETMTPEKMRNLEAMYGLSGGQSGTYGARGTTVNRTGRALPGPTNERASMMQAGLRYNRETGTYMSPVQMGEYQGKINLEEHRVEMARRKRAGTGAPRIQAEAFNSMGGGGLVDAGQILARYDLDSLPANPSYDKDLEPVARRELMRALNQRNDMTAFQSYVEGIDKKLGTISEQAAMPAERMMENVDRLGLNASNLAQQTYGANMRGIGGGGYAAATTTPRESANWMGQNLARQREAMQPDIQQMDVLQQRLLGRMDSQEAFNMDLGSQAAAAGGAVTQSPAGITGYTSPGAQANQQWQEMLSGVPSPAQQPSGVPTRVLREAGAPAPAAAAPPGSPVPVGNYGGGGAARQQAINQMQSLPAATPPPGSPVLPSPTGAGPPAEAWKQGFDISRAQQPQGTEISGMFASPVPTTEEAVRNAYLYPEVQRDQLPLAAVPGTPTTVRTTRVDLDAARIAQQYGQVNAPQSGPFGPNLPAQPPTAMGRGSTQAPPTPPTRTVPSLFPTELPGRPQGTPAGVGPTGPVRPAGEAAQQQSGPFGPNIGAPPPTAMRQGTTRVERTGEAPSATAPQTERSGIQLPAYMNPKDAALSAVASGASPDEAMRLVREMHGEAAVNQLPSSTFYPGGRVVPKEMLPKPQLHKGIALGSPEADKITGTSRTPRGGAGGPAWEVPGMTRSREEKRYDRVATDQDVARNVQTISGNANAYVSDVESGALVAKEAGEKIAAEVKAITDPKIRARVQSQLSGGLTARDKEGNPASADMKAVEAQFRKAMASTTPTPKTEAGEVKPGGTTETGEGTGVPTSTVEKSVVDATTSVWSGINTLTESAAVVFGDPIKTKAVTGYVGRMAEEMMGTKSAREAADAIAKKLLELWKPHLHKHWYTARSSVGGPMGGTGGESADTITNRTLYYIKKYIRPIIATKYGGTPKE